MAQQTKSSWMNKLNESDLSFIHAVDRTTSLSFKHSTLPLCHSAPTKEWQKTLKANKELTNRYRREKQNAADLKERVLEYQSRFTNLMVENNQNRHAAERLEVENNRLRRQNDGMKSVLEAAVNNFTQFVDVSQLSGPSLNEPQHITLDETIPPSNASSALLTDELDSRRTSMFSGMDGSDFAETTVNLPDSNANTLALDESSDQISEDPESESDDETIALNLRKSMAVVGQTKLSRKSSRKTMRKTIQKRSRQSEVVDKRKSEVQPRRISRRLTQQKQKPDIDENNTDQTSLNTTATDMNVTTRKSKQRRSTRFSTEDSYIKPNQARLSVSPDMTLILDDTTLQGNASIDEHDSELQAVLTDVVPTSVTPEVVLIEATTPITQNKSTIKRGPNKKKRILQDDYVSEDNKENTSTPSKPKQMAIDLEVLTNTGRPSRRARKQVSYVEDDGTSKLRRGDKMSDNSLYTSLSPKKTKK